MQATSTDNMTTITFAEFWRQKYATSGQYFFTRVISQRIGAVLAYAACRSGITPNQVTLMGLLVMLLASACFAVAGADGELLLLAAVLFQLGFGIDCADGQLARGTGKTSAFGAWLDVCVDHARHLAIVAAVLVNLQDSPVTMLQALAAGYLLATGLTVYLHTATMLKAGSYQPASLLGWRHQLRRMVKELTDTPLFLMVLCIVALWPPLLALFCAAMGLLTLVQALALAALRIR